MIETIALASTRPSDAKNWMMKWSRGCLSEVCLNALYVVKLVLVPMHNSLLYWNLYWHKHFRAGLSKLWWKWRRYSSIRSRIWANAQRHGRPPTYRWRPLFNAAKFGWLRLLECRAVTLPRRESCWNYLGCPKLTKRSQPLVDQSSPYCGDM